MRLDLKINATTSNVGPLNLTGGWYCVPNQGFLGATESLGPEQFSRYTTDKREKSALNGIRNMELSR